MRSRTGGSGGGGGEGGGGGGEGGGGALGALRAESKRLLGTALALRVLVTRKRARPAVFASERRTLRRRALERQCEDERAVNSAMSRVLAVPAGGAEDAIDLEERLVKSVDVLSAKLFDQTVDTQQLELIAKSVRLGAVAAAEARREAAQASARDSSKGRERRRGATGADGASVGAGGAGAFEGGDGAAGLFAQRDELAAQVLSLSARLAALRERELQLDREILERQSAARAAWRATPGADIAGDHGVAAGADAPGTRGGPALRELRRRNAWLKHVLTTVLMEQKHDWAGDELLLSLMLGRDDNDD
jgi:hypothetical protein